MSKQDLSLALEVALATSGFGKLSEGIAEIKKTGGEVSELENELSHLSATFDKIGRETALIENFKSLKKESKSLSQQIGRGAGDTKKLQAQKKQLGEQLKIVRTEMDKAGISARGLTAKEKELAQQSASTQKSLKKLADEANELKAIGDARIKLGITDQDKINKELAETTKAYNLLKNSGTLSSTELANANQLHAKKVTELEQQLKDLKPTISDVRGELGKFAGASAAFTLIAREAMQFETAMAGVKKVVDGTPEQIDELSSTIKQLAYELGLTAEQTAAIAAMGGQLNVAFDDLPKFTRLAGEMSVAFGMTAEEAGNAAAKMANVWGLPLEQVRELGDAINTLGNNTAAKEAEITAAMLRIGGNAKQFGLAAEEAAALADAMIALGKPPEVAATAINALLLKLQTAETLGKKAQGALQEIGFSANEMANNIQQNPQKAITDFISKLEEMDNQARSIALSELFGAEYADDISLLVAGSESLANAFDLVSDKVKTNGALNKEYTAQTETSEFATNQARQAVSNLATTLGESLLPAIELTAKGIGSTADVINEFAETHPVVTQLAVSFAALKIGMMGVGTASKLVGAAMPLLNSGLATTATTSAAATTGLTTATAATKGYATAVGFLGKAMKLVSSTPLALALIGVITAVDLLIPKTEEWEESIRSAHDALSDLQLKAADGIDIELNDETLKPVKDAIAEIDAELDILSDDTGVFDFLSESIGLWDSNVDKARELNAEKQELISRENELKKQIADRAAAEEAAAEKARAYAEEQKQVAAENLELLLARKAQLEELGETETAYYRQVISSLNKLNGEIDKGQNAARKALEQLGLSAGELQTGISKAAQQAIDDFSAAASEFGKDTDSMAVIYKAALEKMNSPEAVAALNGQLESVAEKVGDISGAYKTIIASSMSASLASKKAFAELGVDVDGVMTGISSKATQAMSNFSKAMAAAKDDGITSMELTQAAIQKVLDTLNSKEEFAAFNSQLKEAEILSKTTAEQQKQIADGLKESTAAMSDSAKEVSENVKAQSEDMTAYQQSLTDAFNAGSLSLENYDKLMKQSKEATDESTESAKQKAEATTQQTEATKKSTAATEEDTSAAKANTQGVIAWTENAKNRIRTLEQLGLTTEQTSQAVEAYQRRMDGGAVASLEQYLQKVTGVADEITRQGEAFAETRNRAIEMTDVLQSNTVSTEDLAMAQDALFRATQASVDGIVQMDQTTLDNLRNAIEKTKAEMEDFADTTEEKAQRIKAQLESLRGNDSYKREYEQAQALKELQEELAKAQQTGNKKAIENIQEAIRYQKELYEEKEKQIEQDKRQQAEREKSRNERKERREESTRSGGNGGAPFDKNLFANKFSQTLTSELNKADTISLADSIARDTAAKVIKKLKEDKARTV